MPMIGSKWDGNVVEKQHFSPLEARNKLLAFRCAAGRPKVSLSRGKALQGDGFAFYSLINDRHRLSGFDSMKAKIVHHLYPLIGN